MEPAHAPVTSNIADFMERLIAGLLGLGWSDASQFTGIYRRYRLRGAGSRREQLGLILGKPIRAARRVRAFVAKDGKAVAAVHGVGPLRQFVTLLLVDLRYSVDPGRFMTCWAFGSGVRHKWRGYLTPWLSHCVLGELAERCDAALRAELRDKRTFARWAARHQLPSVAVLAEFESGYQAGPAAAELPPTDLFAKPSDLYCGQGAIRWTHRDGRWRDQDGNTMDAGALRSELARRSVEHPYVLQRCLAPHPAMTAFSNTAVPTVRAVTCMDRNGEARLFRAALRLPMPGMIVDNVTAGGMVAAVEPGEGVLSGAVRWRDDGLAEYTDRHPSGGAIPGFRVPDWPAVVRLAVAAQRAAGTLPFVGWDVALTSDGPVLLEANLRFAADLLAVPHRSSLSAAGFDSLVVSAWFRGVDQGGRRTARKARRAPPPGAPESGPSRTTDCA